MKEKYRDIDTRVVHSAEPRLNGTVVLPIYQTAMHLTPRTGEEAYNDIKYLRLNNSPNHEVLGEKLAGEFLVLADIGRDHFFDLAGRQQHAETEIVNAAIIRNDSEVLDAGIADGDDQTFGNAAKPETAGHDHR